jgi:hypothetical protein
LSLLAVSEGKDEQVGEFFFSQEVIEGAGVSVGDAEV